MTDTPSDLSLFGSSMVAGTDREQESPRMEYLFGQLRIALSVAKTGIRAGGLLDTDFMLRISFDDELIVIEGLGDVAGSRVMDWLRMSLIDQGFVVDGYGSAPALVVEGYKQLSPHIH